MRRRTSQVAILAFLLLGTLTPLSAQEIEVLKAVVDEGKKAGVMVQVHAVSTPAMMAAVDAGVPLLVHLPNKDWTSVEDAPRPDSSTS